VSDRAAGWRSAPDEVAPTVLIIGGFLTSPPFYARLRARLQALGAAAVVVAPIWLPDWLLAAPRGLGPIVTRAGRALLRSCEVAEVASRGAPVLIVGHSAGAVVARLLTSPEPFQGRRLGASERIGAIVSLGTPHLQGADPRLWFRTRDAGRRAIEHLERCAPGAAFAPRVGYVSVAADSVIGRPDRPGRAVISYRRYQMILGSGVEPGGEPGDGVVPVAAALLPGSRQLLLHDVGHGVFGILPWYGSEGIVERWWPDALDAWHAALRARLEPRSPIGEGQDGIAATSGGSNVVPSPAD
jgi:hypothetical protein